MAARTEFLLVTYPTSRVVKANDVPVGDTNETLGLPADFYTITLDGDDDYTPSSTDVVLAGTGEGQPRVVRFLPKKLVSA
jgi:hypothetical protein